jgi:8-hydroxy-5-deazaflavin:NADPH oxidoreductase
MAPSSIDTHRKQRNFNREVVQSMATLGLIGSGHIGGTLARLAVDAGLDVVLSNSRAPQTLSDLVDELGPQARAATPAQAAAAGDWVVVTIPLGAIRTIPREPLAGKTVIDTGNYFAPRDGTIPELEAHELTDSEMLQRPLADAHVVKAFNNIHYKHLRVLPRPVETADRTALPIAGNDPRAKRHAAELLSLLGYDCVDMGPLTESWRSQLGTPVFCAPYAVTKDDQYRTQPAAPAPAAEVRGAGVGTPLSHERHGLGFVSAAHAKRDRGGSQMPQDIAAGLRFDRG